MHVAVTDVNLCVIVLLNLENIFFQCFEIINNNWFLQSFVPSAKISKPWGTGSEIDISFRGKHSTVSNSLNLDQLWVFALIAIYYWCLQCGLSDSLMHGYSD